MKNLHLFSFSSRRRQQTPISLTIIPQEVVNALFSYLSTIDGICLALTCKLFYNYFHLSLRGQNNKQLSLLFPGRQQSIIYRNIDLQSQPRVQLLHQLENKRWKFCTECWRLHRRSAWRLPFHDVSYTNETVPSSRPIKSCMPYAGTQDICPCWKITYPDKIRLIRALEKIATIRSPDKKRIRGSPTCIRHNCNLTGQHPLAHINVTTELHWDDEQDRLRVRSKYTFRDTAQFKDLIQQNSNVSLQVSGIPSHVRTPLMCPHKRPRRWLKQFFTEMNADVSGLSIRYTNVDLYSRDCHCGEAGTNIRSYDGLSIYLERDMGGLSWLGKAWGRDLARLLDETSIILSLLSYRWAPLCLFLLLES